MLIVALEETTQKITPKYIAKKNDKKFQWYKDNIHFTEENYGGTEEQEDMMYMKNSWKMVGISLILPLIVCINT